MKYFLLIGFLLWSDLCGAGSLPDNPLYSNTPLRSYRMNTSQPRVVTNFLGSKYRRYIRSTGINWSDFPASTGLITWGDAIPTFTVTSLGTPFEQAFAFASFNALIGQTYLVSFYIDAKSGTLSDAIMWIAGITTDVSTQVTDYTLGRHVVKFTATSSGTAIIRLGIGCFNGEPSHVASITLSKIQLEISKNVSRIYPYEYVAPNDSRIFDYTFTAAVTGNVVTSETLGSSYGYRNSQSVLVLGDSFTDDRQIFSTYANDFPFYMTDYFQHIYPVGVSSRGVSGQTISQITTQLVNAMAETSATYTARVAPWKTVVLEGGVNDVNTGRTLPQLQADRQSQIDTANSYGLQIVIMDICPFNSASVPQQAIIDGFNAWLPTLGYPVYKCFTDMTNGANQWRTDAVTPEGVHPGQGYRAGAYQMAFKMLRLLSFLP